VLQNFCGRPYNVPDLRGRLPLHQGNNHVLGEMGGVENVTLVVGNLPPHTHSMGAGTAANSNASANNFYASGPTMYYAQGTPVPLNPNSGVPDGGGDQPHTNIQPIQCVTFIIALEGIYPSRN
jgi:microcystin-dependent protein